MNISKDLLKKYARLSVATGINVQKDQILVINSPVECASFTRLIVEEAYKLGASEVYINWNDEICGKYTYQNASMETLENVPAWKVDSLMYYAKKGAGFLSISASDPDLLKDVDPKKLAAARKAKSLASKEYYDRVMSNKNPWSIIALPTDAWASKVFPELSTEDAVKKLWGEIFKIVRVDKEDPVAAWEEHKKNLSEKMKYLNDKNFSAIHFTNKMGTDLTVGLVKNHKWLGGSDFTPEGIEFIANMPTEEIFTMPDKRNINGTVYSTKPLNNGGTLINNFSITFKDGRVTDFKAEEGYDSLKQLLETDEGAKSLGEVALVPFDSPISNSNIIFFNTLFDENASCHLALGQAYDVCLENSENMSADEKSAVGENDSLIHVDFMIGSADLSIDGIGEDGSVTPIFRDGNWI